MNHTLNNKLAQCPGLSCRATRLSGPRVRLNLAGLGLLLGLLVALTACSSRTQDDSGSKSSTSILPSQIIEAVKQDDVEIVTDWLKNNRDGTEATSPAGRTALFYAAEVQDSRVLDTLLSHGASPGFRDPEGFTPLFYAASLGGRNLSNVRRLLEAGADAQQDGTKITEGMDIAILSAGVGVIGVDTAKLFLEHGASPTLPDRTGHTPLHSAAMFMQDEDIEYTRLYISYSGGSVDPRNHDGATPALLAAVATHYMPHLVDALREFANAGADLSASLPEGPNAGTTVAMLALEALGDEVEDLVKKALLESNHKVDQKGALGFTLMHYAAKSNAPSVVRFLHNAGADLNAQGNLGKTPLHLAASAEAVESIETLVSLGARTDIKNELGATPAESARNDTIRDLLR